MNKNVVFLSIIIMFMFSVQSYAYADDTCTFSPTVAYNKSNAWTLDKGINLSKSWRGRNPAPLTDHTYLGLNALGITFVRLPVAEQSLKLDNKEEQRQSLDKLRCDIISLLNNGIAVILDFHPSKDLKPILSKEKPEQLKERLTSYWAILKEAVSDLPADKIYISILNEPPHGMKDWWSIQGDLVETIRIMFPDNTLIVTPYQGAFRYLKGRVPYADKNILYDFHFYKPLFFTHHNASWLRTPLDPREKTDNLRYPSLLEHKNAADYTKMQKYIDTGWDKEQLETIIENGPIAWHKKTGAKVICLEFGVYKYFVDKPSRYRWLRDVREIFEKNDIPWAMWDYNGGFGLYNHNKNGLDVLDIGVARALGLNVE